MHSSIRNGKEFCYIAPVKKNEIGKMNVICEGFVISETRNAYTFVCDALFMMCHLRNKQ